MAEKKIIKVLHRCGHEVGYEATTSSQGEIPSWWRGQLCDECQDEAYRIAHSTTYSVVESRRESGEWAGDR